MCFPVLNACGWSLLGINCSSPKLFLLHPGQIFPASGPLGQNIFTFKHMVTITTLCVPPCPSECMLEIIWWQERDGNLRYKAGAPLMHSHNISVVLAASVHIQFWPCVAPLMHPCRGVSLASLQALACVCIFNHYRIWSTHQHECWRKVNANADA